MKKNSALAYVGHNKDGDREKNDFYPTPIDATEELLQKQKFIGDIWEPACGDGAMSRVMEDFGYNVFSTDLVDRGYGQSGVDFLMEMQKFDNIVTNPPFSLAMEFTLKALELARNKVVMLSKISYLEGLERREKLFNQKKLEKVLVFSRRIPFKKANVEGKGSGLMAFGWFIYDVNYNGFPTIEWI